MEQGRPIYKNELFRTYESIDTLVHTLEINKRGKELSDENISQLLYAYALKFNVLQELNRIS